MKYAMLILMPVIFIVACQGIPVDNDFNRADTIDKGDPDEDDLKRFNSTDELRTFLRENAAGSGRRPPMAYGFARTADAAVAMESGKAAGSDEGRAYPGTNVQVGGWMRLISSRTMAPIFMRSHRTIS